MDSNHCWYSLTGSSESGYRNLSSASKQNFAEIKSDMTDQKGHVDCSVLNSKLHEAILNRDAKILALEQRIKVLCLFDVG